MTSDDLAHLQALLEQIPEYDTIVVEQIRAAPTMHGCARWINVDEALHELKRTLTSALQETTP